MAITDNENTYLEGFFSHLDSNENLLSEWEQGFIADQKKRWEEFSDNVFMSPKQWGIIKRCAEKIGYDVADPN